MRAPRLISRCPFATILAISCATSVLSGCPQSPSPQVVPGSTTGSPGNALSQRDAESLALKDDLQPAPAHGTVEQTPADAHPPVTEPLAAVTEPASTPAPPPATESSPASATTTPGNASWPNFRNGTDLRGIAGSTLPDDLELLWELPTHDGVTSTAAIDGGRAYVAELSGNVRCLDLRSGQEYWHYRTIESQDPEEFAPGFNAPVTLSEKVVFVGDEEGTFHALDRETGIPLWKPFVTEGEIKGGATLLTPDPTTGAPRVMFGSHDGKLYCLNADTGEEIWVFDTFGQINGSQAVTAASRAGEPASGRLTFVTDCNKPVLRVVDIGTGQEAREFPMGSLLFTSPALVGDILYFGTPDGEVVALDWVKQQPEWVYKNEQRTFEIHSCPAVTDQLVVIGSRDKRVHAVDRLTGEGVWTFETRGPVDSSPVVVGDRIFFGSADRNIYGVDLRGNEVWKHSAGSRISASPAVGEGYLVIGCEGADGKLLCFGSK